ncbi:MAG: Maf family protein [Betaproteobacteria bacterium]
MKQPLIYLASQSPRRAQLLEQMGLRFETLLPDPQEDAEALEAVRGSEPPARYVQRVTALKLDAALERRQRLVLPDAPILCADTTVAIGSEILGKPTDAQHAAAMLRQLSGRTHRVLTAVAVQSGRRRVQALSVSRVTFEPMSAQQIRDYVACGEPFGKAGAYAVQGRAAMYIRHISGSYSGIMGLPLRETAQLLRQLRLGPS